MPKRKLAPEVLEAIELCASDEYILDEIDNFGTKKHFKKYGKEYKAKYLKYQILLTIDVMFSEAIGCLYYEIETNRVGLKPRLTLDEHMFGKNKDEDEKLDNSMELDPVYKKVNTADSKEPTYGQNNFNFESIDRLIIPFGGSKGEPAKITPLIDDKKKDD